MPKIKAVLFDMDGVLIDAREWHYEALNNALAVFGYHISRDEHLTTYDGLPTRKKLEILSESRGLPIKLHALLNNLKQKHTVRAIINHCRPTFHHLYMLENLRRDGYKLAMCSNSIRRTVTMMADLARIDRFFETMLATDDIKKPKPDPELYFEAAKRLGVKPEECLVVEDNNNGIQAAKAAGAAVLEVATPDDVTYERVKEAIKTATSEVDLYDDELYEHIKPTFKTVGRA
jgi:beta-phosphoglucomutase